MNKLLKRIFLAMCLKSLDTSIGRQLFRILPVPFNSLRSKRVNLLKQSRLRASGPQEIVRINHEIAVEMKRIEIAGLTYSPPRPGPNAPKPLIRGKKGDNNPQQLLEEIGYILEQNFPEIAAKEYGESTDEVKIIAIAQMVLSKLHSNFSFNPAIFEIFKQGALKSNQIDILRAALETAPNLQAALEALDIRGKVSARPNLFDSQYAFVCTVFDAILVDNGIDLAIAEILQRRFLPNSKVFIGNRAIASPTFEHASTYRVASWIPVMESESAYYTQSEEALDKEFQSWWARLTPALGEMFSHEGSALLSPERGETFLFLLKDKLYLHYREIWSWRHEIKSWSRNHGNGGKLLALSNRPQLFSPIATDLCKLKNISEFYFWSPQGLSLTEKSALSPDMLGWVQLQASSMLLKAKSKNWSTSTSTSGSSFMGKTSDDLALHFQKNIFGDTEIREYTIITSSSTRVYWEFALKLAKKLGYKNCLIVDIYFKNSSFISQCNVLGVGYANAYTAAAYADLSAWEQDLVDSLLRRVVDVILSAEMTNNEILEILLDSSILHQTLCSYLRTVEAIRLMENLIDASEIETPQLIFCPGRLPLPLGLAKNKRIQSTEVQFFMNSDSFRYQKPKSDKVYVIDTVEKKMISSRFKGVKPSILGSPAIDINLRSDLLEIGKGGLTLPPIGPWIVLLPLQPIDAKNYVTVMDELVALCAADPRFSVSIKPHAHNSHGLTTILMSRVPNSLRNFFTITNEDPYRLIKSSDIVVGFSSNMLIEAAALRKGVFQLQRDFVEKYMVPRNVAKTVKDTDLAEAIQHYVENIDNRSQLLNEQSVYFQANPGMDALSSYDLYHSLASKITS